MREYKVVVLLSDGPTMVILATSSMAAKTEVAQKVRHLYPKLYFSDLVNACSAHLLNPQNPGGRPRHFSL